MDQFFSVGPLVAGTGMNITVWSYVDQLNFSVLTDEFINEPHVLTDSLLQELIVIRRSAGLAEKLTTVDTAMKPAVAANGQASRATPDSTRG